MQGPAYSFQYLPDRKVLAMIVYEDYHFGEQREISLYHIKEFSHFPHFHRSYELLYLKSGSLKAVIDGREFLMEPGHLVLVLPYEIHSYINLGGAECYVNVFSPDYILEFYSMTAKKTLNCPLLNLEEPVFAHMEKHLFLDNSKPLYTKAYLYYIGARLLDQSTLIPRKAQTADLLHQILTYIQEHYTQELTLQDLATHLGYSRLYLSRFINSSLSASFTDLVNQHRINFAAHLLRTTDNPVSDIAFSCGYSSLCSFNRCFKELQQVTPRQYRDRFLVCSSPGSRKTSCPLP